jgi:L-aminopeptidase/D-esterase-like protein
VNPTLTSVGGIKVGHALTPDRESGCTVVLGPFRGAVEVRGLATGSRELGVLAPEHLVARVDGILLSGGSVFGLAAADGVVGWLDARGRGFETGVASVPIVPSAVIFDLATERDRPGPAEGRGACEAASGAPVGEGRVGAGRGATVGKIRGPGGAAPGGLGSWALDAGGHRVGALAVVNALGDVRAADGTIVAGARDPEGGGLLDTFAAIRDGAALPSRVSQLAAGSSTTLAVVATDAPLGAVDLARVARVASNALARRITPVHTPYDGDVVFAVSTAEEVRDHLPGDTLTIAVAAQEALEAALERAVTVPAHEMRDPGDP